MGKGKKWDDEKKDKQKKRKEKGPSEKEVGLPQREDASEWIRSRFSENNWKIGIIEKKKKKKKDEEENEKEVLLQKWNSFPLKIGN